MSVIGHLAGHDMENGNEKKKKKKSMVVDIGRRSWVFDVSPMVNVVVVVVLLPQTPSHMQ